MKDSPLHPGFQFDQWSDSTTEKTVSMYHKIVESFKFAFARRGELGDMAFADVEDVRNVFFTEKYKLFLNKREKVLPWPIFTCWNFTKTA